jgi:hypothetical protein
MDYEPARKMQLEGKRMADKYNVKVLNCGMGCMDFSENWSCCGAQEELTSNHTLGRAVKIAQTKPDGIVRYEEFFDTMNEQAEALKTVEEKMIINCGSDEYYYARTKSTLFDKIRSAWDNPRSFYSPERCFDNMVVGGKDVETGHLYYKYVGKYLTA